MADWTTLSNQAVGVGGLPSGTTVTALRDNPVAIAEGATGAPKVENKALAGLFLGFLEVGGEVWTGLSDLDEIGGIFLSGRASSDNGSILIRFSDDNGSTWGSQTSLDGGAPARINTAEINLIDGSYYIVSDIVSDSGTASIPAGTVNAFQLQVDPSGSVTSSDRLSFLVYATKGKST